MEPDKNLKIIHLATSHEGGAGISARRLNTQLNKFGVKSHFYALERNGYVPRNNEFSIKRNLALRLLSYCSAKIAKITSGVTFFSIYSSPGISIKWLNQICKDEKVVLHIHNWFNLISIKQLKKISAKGIPVVITMHDQRLMTGGCHTTLDCDKFHDGCKKCPKIKPIFRTKVYNNSLEIEKLFKTKMNKLQIIAPSKFMVIEAAKSYNLKFQKVEFIPNKFAVDLSVDRDASSKLKLGNDFIIGIASAKPREVLKGGDLIFELSNTIIKDNLQLSLLYLKDFPQSEQNEFWEQIDCLLVPSRGDNSPNVIHEAKFFNIPVIATNVGGIPELLFSSFDILLDVKSISVQDILQAILQIKSQNISNEAILQMRNFYDSYTLNSITNLVKIYEKLIESI